MKKLLLLFVFLSVGICTTFAQQASSKPPPPGGTPKCDSLEVDSVAFVPSGPELRVWIRNNAQLWVPYPSLEGILTPNPYIKLSTQLSYNSVLDSVNGPNGGITMFTIPVDSLQPQDSIPPNTVFTGIVHLADPTDTILYCNYNISFTYGREVVAGVSVQDAQSTLRLMVANEMLIVKGYPDNSTMQILNMAGQVLFADNNVRGFDARSIEIGHLPAGIYLLAIQRDGERIVRKFLKE
jgi:hypothetical protein